MSEKCVNGPEDTVVSEIIKHLPQELHRHKILLGTFQVLANQKLLGHRVDVDDVEVVRIVYCSSSGKRKRNPTAGDSHTWVALTASSGDDDTALAETLGLAGGQKATDVAQQRET